MVTDVNFGKHEKLKKKYQGSYQISLYRLNKPIHLPTGTNASTKKLLKTGVKRC